MPWVTPDDPPGADICIRVYCPAGVDYEAALRGAVLELTKVENWEEIGTQTVEDVSQAFFDAYQKTLDWRRCMAIGAVFFFAGTTAPEGSLVCDGSVFDAIAYPDLFNVIGYTYGGAGRFVNLPDLREIFARGSSTGSPVGSTGGQATVTLTESQMPSHKHDMGIGLITGGGLEPLLVYTEEILLGKDTGDTGGDGSHENTPPFMALLPCIIAR